MEFVPASPVQAFGAWVFDDFGIDMKYRLQVTEVGGAISTSEFINNGCCIQGFLGVTSNLGIARVLVEQHFPESTAEAPELGGGFLELFEVDYVQFSVPEPSAVGLMGLACTLLCYCGKPKHPRL